MDAHDLRKKYFKLVSRIWVVPSTCLENRNTKTQMKKKKDLDLFSASLLKMMEPAFIQAFAVQ